MAITPFAQLLATTIGPPFRAEHAAALGLRAIEERREEDALPILLTATAHRPSDAPLLHVLGLLHRALGDLGATIAVLDRAVTLTPHSARLVHLRARAALEGGASSLDWFTRARLLAPNDGEVLLGQAAALLAEGQGKAADTLLSTMIEDHPGWLPGHAALIRLRYAWGDADDWLASLDKAIAGAPRDARLHHMKVTVLHRAGHGDGARAALAAAEAAVGATPLAATAAIVAAEYGTPAEADAAWIGLDVSLDADLVVHRLRHLLRRNEPERVVALAESLPPALTVQAWPYISLAWRLLGDARSAWLDDDRLIKVVDFGEDWPLLAPLADTLRGLHDARHHPLDQSVRGGTQTDGPLLSRLDPTIRALRSMLERAVADYITALPAADGAHPLLGRIPRRPRFVGSWSVRLAGGGFHDSHVHDEGWLSSALYIALPDREPAGGGWLTLGEPQKSLGLNLAPLRTIEPRAGRLVLFPSTMWHGTRPFARGERLTVAFDIA